MTNEKFFKELKEMLLSSNTVHALVKFKLDITDGRQRQFVTRLIAEDDKELRFYILDIIKASWLNESRLVF